MDWIFWAIAGASVVHVVEEYVLPGGFQRWMNDVGATACWGRYVPGTVSGAALYVPLAVIAYALESPSAGTAAASVGLGAAIHAVPPLALVPAR